MRRRLLGTAAFGAAVLLVLPTAAAMADDTGSTDAPNRTPEATAIRTADPGTLDDSALRRMLATPSEARERDRAQTRRHAIGELPDPIRVRDDEPAGGHGDNDSVDDAQPVDGFGTGPTSNPRLDIRGVLGTKTSTPKPVAAAAEDNGAIPLAHDLDLSEERPSIRTTGRIGDGPHGSNGDRSGDYDVYSVRGVPGNTLTVDLANAGGNLVPSMVLLDADGNLITGVQPMLPGETAVHLSYRFDRADTFYLVAGSATPYPVPNDPFDSGSGFGVGTEGKYDLTAAIEPIDVDVYAVELAAGDVLGTRVEGAGGRVEVYDPDGQQVQGSGMDTSSIYPASSPLPGGGNAVADHVAASTGTHYVAITDGSGAYDATVEVYRPKGESSPLPQELFLDFDGARVNNRIFTGAAVEPGVRDLSPLRSFLSRWGLSRADEPAVIDAVARTVEENLAHDLPGTHVSVRTSADHPDNFGPEHVSRVIVGGTVEEAGIIPVVGIAESIDPGNFARNETALALLDRMSAPKRNPVSLNAYFTEDSDRIAAIGRAVGNVISHEAGHYLGNWHTHTSNDVVSVMDTGSIPDLYGLGPDGFAGTADDTDTDFAADSFEPLQGFVGTENTIARTYGALSGYSWLPGEAAAE